LPINTKNKILKANINTIEAKCKQVKANKMPIKNKNKILKAKNNPMEAKDKPVTAKICHSRPI